jgi:choline dehydrogenase-like flavoprotein
LADDFGSELGFAAVAAGAANSAAILLRSASDRHPEGLANGSGQLGRNYMYHNSKAVVARGKGRNDTVFENTPGLNDFYFAGDGGEPGPYRHGQMPSGSASTRRQASAVAVAVAVAAGRQNGSEQPQDREQEADQAEHPVPFAKGEDAQRDQQDHVNDGQGYGPERSGHDRPPLWIPVVTGPERAEGRLEDVQPVTDGFGLLRAGASQGPLGIHGRTDGLQ